MSTVFCFTSFTVLSFEKSSHEPILRFKFRTATATIRHTNTYCIAYCLALQLSNVLHHRQATKGCSGISSFIRTHLSEVNSTTTALQQKINRFANVHFTRRIRHLFKHPTFRHDRTNRPSNLRTGERTRQQQHPEKERERVQPLRDRATSKLGALGLTISVARTSNTLSSSSSSSFISVVALSHYGARERH